MYPVTIETAAKNHSEIIYPENCFWLKLYQRLMHSSYPAQGIWSSKRSNQLDRFKVCQRVQPSNGNVISSRPTDGAHIYGTE